MAIEQTLWWAHVSVSEMLQPLFATCLVRSQTCLLRNESIREAWGLHRNEPNELQSSSQIMSRTGADANQPLLLSIPMWVFLKCCSLCLLHVWSEATQNAIYSISLLIITVTLLIITHHYAIHYSSLLIITQIALLIITHHYTTSDGWKNHCVVWRFDATKLCILGHYAWKSRGGLAPPSIFVRNDE